jgi:hypothetical protein
VGEGSGAVQGGVRAGVGVGSALGFCPGVAGGWGWGRINLTGITKAVTKTQK